MNHRILSGAAAPIAWLAFAAMAFAQSPAPPAITAMDAAASAAADAVAEDPFLWLEQVDSPRAMDWVRAENARTSAVLDADARFATFQAEARALAEAHDRIPQPSFLRGQVYNLWQDGEHPHGLWRRTSLAGYRAAAPDWSTVLDLDALSASEGGNWFWHGVECAEPAQRRCVALLSDGGEDAVTVRELDIATGRFVAGGFQLPKGKQDIAWKGEQALWASREWSPGELTASGYAYVVKQLRRGQPLAAAEEIYRGERSDVGVSPFALDDAQGHGAMGVVRNVTFFESEYRLLTPHGLALLALPHKADLLGMLQGQLLVWVKEDWAPRGGTPVTAGSIVAIALDAALRAPAELHPTIVYAPGERRAFDSAMISRGRLLLAELDNVKSRAWEYQPAAHGAWPRRALPLPADSSIELVSADRSSDHAFVEVTGFLQPTTLWLTDLGKASAVALKALPARFDGSRDVVEQREATSNDGTHIPYFVVRRRDMPLDGSTPTVLVAYGGFGVSYTPYYPAVPGKLWLERGGTLVVANIRGGGEFGPAWHEAGLKTHRQRIYDDFAAVARDLIARGYTSTPHLGIQGGSNGGLLMGVELTQHPELWGAVDIQVPLLDMLRYEQIAAGSSWVAEYGSVSVPEERATSS